MSINGGESANISFPATGSDTNSPSTVVAYVSLQESENTLEFSNPTNLAPNFEKIVASRSMPGNVSASVVTDLGDTWNSEQNTWGWSSGLEPPTNQWSFVALVVQPASAAVYLVNTNGQQSATNSYANPAQAFAGAGAIGADMDSAVARVFSGTMDEVAVFNHALTSAQIQQLYENGHQLSQVLVGAQQSGAKLNLTWQQGTLFQATNLSGPWVRSSNTTSPYTITPTNGAEFFRVLVQ